jgi:hypothetical protein
MEALQQDVICIDVEFNPRIVIQFTTNDAKQINSTIVAATGPYSRYKQVRTKQAANGIQFYTLRARSEMTKS